MINDRSKKKVDSDVVQEIFRVIEHGGSPSVDSLSDKFPGREAEIQAALKAVESYQKRVRKVKAHITDVDHTLSPGTTLGDFSIKSMLGRGAMGIVYRASQKSLANREVALKVLPHGLIAKDPRFVERFRREAALAANVHHRNIAEVYGFGQEGNVIYFAMQLVEGRDLNDVLSGLALRRRLGNTLHLRKDYVRRVVHVVRDVADALATIHNKNLIHRDVKPANIILENSSEDDRQALSGNPVLVDFGLLRPIGPSDITGSQTLLGTPAYASPETQLGRDVDARSDVFSLGALLHDLLSLTLPGQRSLASAGLSGVRALNPTVDVRLASIVTMAVEERPTLRYVDGAAFRADLDRYLQDKPVRSQPSTPAGRIRLWAKRNPTRAWKVGVTGIFSFVLFLVCVWFGISILRIYMSASSGANLEEEGKLLIAADAYRVIYDQRAYTKYLPGMRDSSISRAIEYWGRNSRLSWVPRELRTNTPNAYMSAHGYIQQLLLTNEHRDLRKPLMQFLTREIRDGDSLWKKRLASETAAYFFLIEPLRYQSRRVFETWEAELENTLLEIGCDSKKDSELRYAALSALSGMNSSRVLKEMVLLVGDPDDELHRLAVEGTRRLWWDIRLNVSLLKKHEDLFIDWVRRLWVSANKREIEYNQEIHQKSKKRATLHRDTQRQIFQLMFFAVWTRMEMHNSQLPKNAWHTLPTKAASLLKRIENIFLLYSDDNNVSHGCLSGLGIERYLANFDTRWVYNDLEDKKKKKNNNRKVPYSYNNIWKKNDYSQKGEARKTVLSKQSADTAVFDFTRPIPRLEGFAINARWTGSIASDRQDYFLVLTKPVLSELLLTCKIPNGAKSALVTISHCRATRGPLPRYGKARIQVSLGKNDRIIEQEIYNCGRDESYYVVSSHSIVERNILNISIRLARTNTTYRIYLVKIRFEV